jgi:hypothetical protein
MQKSEKGMNMHKKEYKRRLFLQKSTCFLLQCGMWPIFAALFGICYQATASSLHPASAAAYGEMLEVLLASLALLTAGALVCELILREK